MFNPQCRTFAGDRTAAAVTAQRKYATLGKAGRPRYPNANTDMGTIPAVVASQLVCVCGTKK